MLRRAIDEYVKHYNAERPHQGVGNGRLESPLPPGTGKIESTERLGGMLKHYRRAA